MGYRPELQSRIEKAVIREVTKFRESKKSKKDIPLDTLTNGG